MNDLETAIFVLEEALTFSQDEPLNGDEFTIEMHRCLAGVLFQNEDIEKSLKRSTKILTVSQVRFCEFSPSVCLGTILILLIISVSFGMRKNALNKQYK